MRRTARRQQAAAEWFPRLFLRARSAASSFELNGIELGVGALHQRRRPAGDADLQRGPHAGINEIAESASAKRCCATRTRSCARSRTSRTRWSHSRRAAARGRSADRCRLGGCRARPRAVALRPRPDRSAAAARRAAHAARRAPQREREQHPAAARSVRLLQGARRRVAGLRTRTAKTANAVTPS